MNSTEKFKVQLEEWYAVILSFIYFFCVLASYYIMRPIREQLSAEVGSGQLPLFFAATFVVTLLLTPLFAWLVSTFSRRFVIPIVYFCFIACQLGFISLFDNQGVFKETTLAMMFFVWVSVFNLFVVSVFWSFMTDIWSDIQARRLFPIIALGGTAGAIIGPIITRSLVDIIGVAALLWVSAAFLMIAIICVIFLGKWASRYSIHRSEVNNEGAIGGGMLDGLKQLVSHPFVFSMSVLMLLGDAIGTIGYVLIADYSGSTFPLDALARTRFAANMDLSANIIQVIVQLTLTRWLLTRFGAGIVFCIWAVIVGFACLSVKLIANPYEIIIGSMPWIAVVLILTRALSFAMIQPARETLYTLVPRDVRYKGKNAVDTVVWRAGDTISLFSINRLQLLGVTIGGFGLIGAMLVTLSGWLGWRLSNQVEEGIFEK